MFCVSCEVTWELASIRCPDCGERLTDPAKTVREACEDAPAVASIFIGKSIPTRKLEVAKEHYPIGNDEVLLLVDATVFGSAKVGVAVGRAGIYWNNDWTTSTKRRTLTWDEFGGRRLELSDSGMALELGKDDRIDLAAAGSDEDRGELLRFFRRLQRVVAPNDNAQLAKQVKRPRAAKEIKRPAKEVKPPVKQTKRAADKQVSKPKKKPRKRNRKPHAKSRTIQEACETLPPTDSIFEGESIPKRKLVSVYKHYPIGNDKVLLLVDATVFGSAKVGVAIGNKGIYWNTGLMTSTLRNSLNWAEFAKREIHVSRADSTIELGEGDRIDLTTFSNANRVKLMHFFERLQHIIRTS